MEMKTFCSSMREEMKGWKATIYDLIRKTEEMSPRRSERMKFSIGDMKSMIDRIERTLDRLEKECPINWDSERGDVEQGLHDLTKRWNEAAAMSPDDLE